jgi:hypothetical protein
MCDSAATPAPGEPDRDHAQDVLRLRRRIMALEELADRNERMRGVIVPKTLTAELERTEKWALSIFIDYGFETPCTCRPAAAGVRGRGAADTPSLADALKASLTDAAARRGAADGSGDLDGETAACTCPPQWPHQADCEARQFERDDTWPARATPGRTEDDSPAADGGPS